MLLSCFWCVDEGAFLISLITLINTSLVRKLLKTICFTWLKMLAQFEVDQLHYHGGDVSLKPSWWWGWWQWCWQWCWRWCWRWGQMDGSDWWAGCWTCLISSALPQINNGIQADQGPGRFLRTLPGIKCIKESKKAHDVPGTHLTITLHPIIRPLPTICASLHPSAQRFDGNVIHAE